MSRGWVYYRQRFLRIKVVRRDGTRSKGVNPGSQTPGGQHQRECRSQEAINFPGFLAGDRFPGTGQRADFYHVSEHLWAAARTLHPDDDGAARAWVAPLLTKLKADESCAVITALEQLRPRLEGRAGEHLQREIIYLQTNRNRLDCGTAKKRGEPSAALVAGVCSFPTPPQSTHSKTEVRPTTHEIQRGRHFV